MFPGFNCLQNGKARIKAVYLVIYVNILKNEDSNVYKMSGIEQEGVWVFVRRLRECGQGRAVVRILSFHSLKLCCKQCKHGKHYVV